MGNLGFDTEGPELTTRAKDFLGSLPGFALDDLVHDIRPLGNRPASSVLVQFKECNAGDNWRAKAYAKNFKHPENSDELRSQRGQPGSGIVYLEKQQTDTQRRPWLLTKRCGHELKKIESTIPPEQQKTIKVETRGKLVLVGGKTAGLSFHGQWKWTEDGKRHLQERGVHLDSLTAIIGRDW